MAGVLVERLVRRRHQHLRGPRARPGGGVADRELVEQRVGVQPREALDEVRAGARIAERGLGEEVAGRDDQRVALPARARVADPLADARGQMRPAVERDEPCAVDHLVEDRHVAGRLEDLDVVVVGARGHRRPGVEAEEAAFRDAAVLGAVRVARAEPPRQLALRLDHRPHRGDAPVRRIDDQRGARLGERVAPLEPDAQAVADPELEGGVVALRFQSFPLDGKVRFPLGRLFRRQRLLAGELLGPFHRRGGREVPDALQVGLAVRGPRNLALARGERGCEGDHRARESDDADHRDDSLTHENDLLNQVPGRPCGRVGNLHAVTPERTRCGTDSSRLVLRRIRVPGRAACRGGARRPGSRSARCCLRGRRTRTAGRRYGAAASVPSTGA